jgi:hypothetical protein
MSEINKYNAAHRVSQEIANTIKKLDQSKYEFNLANLLKLNKLIKNECKYNILEDAADNDKTLIEEEVVMNKSNLSSPTSTTATPSKDFDFNLG